MTGKKVQSEMRRLTVAKWNTFGKIVRSTATDRFNSHVAVTRYPLVECSGAMTARENHSADEVQWTKALWRIQWRGGWTLARTFLTRISFSESPSFCMKSSCWMCSWRTVIVRDAIDDVVIERVRQRNTLMLVLFVLFTRHLAQRMCADSLYEIAHLVILLGELLGFLF